MSFTQLATVLAGLDDGISLQTILAHAGVDERWWSRARQQWDDRILDDLELDGDLAESLELEKAHAQQSWTRPLPPLDESLRLWLDFERAWMHESEPARFLADHGLRAADIARLQRIWGNRLAAEPTLAREALDILCEQPGAPCEVHPEPVRLPRRPSTTSPPPGAQPAEAAVDPTPVPSSEPPAWDRRKHDAPARVPAAGLPPPVEALDSDAAVTSRPKHPREQAPSEPPPVEPQSDGDSLNRTVGVDAVVRSPLPQFLENHPVSSPPNAISEGQAAAPRVLPFARQQPRHTLKDTLQLIQAIENAIAWTPEEYARLLASLETNPAHGLEIWAAHGLPDERTRTAVELRWNERLANDPALQAQVDALVARYRGQR